MKQTKYRIIKKKLGAPIKKLTKIQRLEKIRPTVTGIGEFLFPMVKMNKPIRGKK